MSARSPEHQAMAALCVRSLRGMGAYDGPILLYAHQPGHHLVAVNDLCTLIEFPRSDDHLPHTDHYFALQEVSTGGYDQIAYLGADILAQAPITELWCADQDLRYFEEPFFTYATEQEHDLYHWYLYRDEILHLADQHTINDDHWTCPAHLLHSLFRTWQTIYTSRPGHGTHYGANQSAFNALIRRGLIPASPYPLQQAQALDLIGFAARVPQVDWRRYPLMHFAGFTARLEMMRAWSGFG
jgi:hypothetical protein